MGHLTQDEIQRLLADLAKPLLSGHQEAMQIDEGKLGVVIKHLLEMWNSPKIVDAIASKAAANHIVHAAA